MAVLGSLLPDIDHEYSTISKESGLALLSKAIQRVFGHRTITHSLLFLVGVAVLSSPLAVKAGRDWWLALWLFGVASHYLTDMMTLSGIPLLYPLFRNRMFWVLPRPLRFTTGGWQEKTFLLLLGGAFLFLGWKVGASWGVSVRPFWDRVFRWTL